MKWHGVLVTPQFLLDKQLSLAGFDFLNFYFLFFIFFFKANLSHQQYENKFLKYHQKVILLAL